MTSEERLNGTVPNGGDMIQLSSVVLEVDAAIKSARGWIVFVYESAEESGNGGVGKERDGFRARGNLMTEKVQSNQ